eukprot:7039467-Prymnesium_polylepis.1
MAAEAERGAKRRRSAEEQRMARFDSTLLQQQKVWAQGVARFAAFCRGPRDAVPKDELHSIICRDSSAVLELHLLIESHPPTGALNWDQNVNDCAFDAWRKIEPLLKGEDTRPAKRWDEMMALPAFVSWLRFQALPPVCNSPLTQIAAGVFWILSFRTVNINGALSPVCSSDGR